MTTTSEQIAAMKSLAEKISADPSIDSAIVDDWGRHGNFQVIVYPKQKDRHTTRRLRALLTRHLKETDAHLRDIFGPDPIKKQVLVDSGRYEPRVVGYSRDYWMIDIDYVAYNADLNLFASQDEHD